MDFPSDCSRWVSLFGAGDQALGGEDLGWKDKCWHHTGTQAVRTIDDSQLFNHILVFKKNISLILYLVRPTWRVERDNDTSGRNTRWKYAVQDVGVYICGLNGLGALTESNTQALVFTKAISHEEDLLTAGDRPMIRANLLKGNRRSESF